MSKSIQTEKYEQPIIRYESLTIPIDGTNGKDSRITFESDEPDTVAIFVDKQFVGISSMENFIALCRRVLELWEDNKP